MAETRYYQNMRSEVMALLPNKPKRALELGCGEGLFGNELKRLWQCHVTGIELFEEVAQVARERLDKVYNESLDEFNFSRLEKYDLIIANDVLEHLKDPWSVVKELKEHLTDGGYFVASIPNIQYHQTITALLKGRWDYKDSGILDRTHLRFFTRQTASELFVNNGYVVEKNIPINIDRVSKTNVLKRILMHNFKDMYALQFLVIAKNKE